MKRIVLNFHNSSISSSSHEIQLGDENQLSDEEMVFLREYATSKSGPGFAGLRNALHIALGLSPILLLLPLTLTKKHLNKKTLTLVGV